MENKPWLRFYDPGVPASLRYPEISLQDFLRRSAQMVPQQACTIYQNRVITYAQMDALSDALARGLVALGVGKGEPVGLMMPNLPQFVLAFYAILKAGGVVAAINPLYRLRELEFQVLNSGIHSLIALSTSRELVDSLPPSARPAVRIYSDAEDAFVLPGWLTGEGSIPNPEGVTGNAEEDLSLPDLVAFYAGDQASLPAVRPPDAAIFQYTGGTTGTPKAAVGLHRNLVANTLQFRAWLAGLQDGQEVFLTAIPLYHVYGMVIGMSVGIAMGASLVLISDARNVPDILEKIQTYQATFFPGVPNMYHAINQHPDVIAGRYDLHSIKACISGSAPLLRHIKDKFEALTGGKLVEGYGLSEAPTATHCNPVQGENRPGSIGLPLPDVEARIVDLEEGQRVLASGEVGELVVSGPQVMAGYHNMPEDTLSALRDGWLYTGDIARMDEDGYFYVVDRKKELIKIGGFQVWPREIEEVISLHPKVQEVGAAGVPDPERGERVKAWVVLKAGQNASVDEIRQWCAGQMAGYKVPSLVEFRGPLPRSTVGKLLRRELVREYLENQK